MKFLSDPTQLRPMLDQGILQVIVETPAGSRMKYDFDEEQRIFRVRKMLPAGMAFPHDFGFLPGTIGGDGDPLDVLLLIEEPLYPGISVRARLIGAFAAEQSETQDKGQAGSAHKQNGKVRNDVLVAVAEASHLHAALRNLSELPPRWPDELRAFFTNYHRLEGKDYRILATLDADAAFELVRAGCDAASGPQPSSPAEWS